MTWRSCLLAVMAFCACSNISHAQIYRWDNGQVIPGTEGITLGPGVQLYYWNTAAKNLKFGDFQGDLTGADFSGSWVDDSRFAGANLTNAFLAGSTLTNANLTGATVTGANFARSWDGEKWLGTGLTPTQLASTDSYAAKNLQGIRLEQNDLTGWDFRGQDLTHAYLGSSTLTNAEFSDAAVTAANFDATGISSSQLYSTASYRSGDLHGIGLGNIDLTGWDFRGQNLMDASFTHFLYPKGSAPSNLSQANFTGSNLTRTNFHRATLTDAILTDANLVNARLDSSKVINASFTGAVVNGADFSDSGITAAQLYSTASYRAKDLHGINLSANDVSGWDFSGQNIRDAEFGVYNPGASSLTKNQLYSTASYQSRDLHGIGLANCDLTDWDFSGQNLAGANLNGSNLGNANFNNAIVTNTKFYDANSFTAAQLYSTASYQSKDLHGIWLAHLNLTGWDFSGQNLTGALLSDSTLTNANFAGARLVDANLFATMMNTNLSGADLRGATNWDGNRFFSNTILPDGSIHTLVIADLQLFTVRDDDGVPDPSPSGWIRPRAPIPVTVYQQMTVTSDGVLELVLDADTWGSTIKFQAGIPVQLGGTLELTFTDDSQLASQSGRTIQAFDWTGVNPQGQFTVKSQPGTAWDTSKLYTTGEVTLLGISSDLNSDKDVDSDDLLDFLENWTGSEYLAADKTWQTGDSDEDGDVDSADMLVFLSQWTGTPAASRVVSVPEPAGAIQVLAALVALLLSILRCREVKQ